MLTLLNKIHWANVGALAALVALCVLAWGSLFSLIFAAAAAFGV